MTENTVNNLLFGRCGLSSGLQETIYNLILHYSRNYLVAEENSRKTLCPRGKEKITFSFVRMRKNTAKTLVISFEINLAIIVLLIRNTRV